MKDIRESFGQTRPIVDCINEARVNEGLKDMLKVAKDKLGNFAKKVFAWMGGIVAQIQNWFMVTNENGDILPCSTPMTAGYAWKNGMIKKNSTFVGLGKQSGKLVGTSEPFKNALKMYPSTKEWWDEIAKRHTNESKSADEIAFLEKIYESNKVNHPAFHNILCGITKERIDEVKMHTEDPQAKYNIIADNKTLREIIKMHITEGDLARLMIWGAPGIGKTAILMAVIDEISAEQGKDYHLIVKTLSNETPDNFMLPKYTDDGRATDVPKTWIPVWHPTGDKKIDAELDAKCGRGMLFIDELSRAQAQVQNVILPLINEGIFNGWKLGSGWSIICASNRDEDEIGSSQTSMSNALSNRFAQVYYEPTVHTWREWADKQGFMSPLLLQWLDMPASETHAGGKFFYFDPNDDAQASESSATTHLMCTPRSWTNAMRDIAKYHHTGKLEGFDIFDIPEWKLKFILNKYVPSDAVDAFWEFLKLIRGIGNFDAAIESAWKGHGKSLKMSPKQLINVALPLSQLVVCAHKDSLPTEAEWDSLVDWMIACDNEQLASYVLDMMKNVFAANIPDVIHEIGSTSAKDQMFLLRYMYNKEPKMWKNIHNFDPFLNAWGITYETMPDYWPGLQKLIKKYGKAFTSAIVDGKDGLG